MDCGIARERLDAARSDPQDREDSELQTAFAHLDECPACAEAYEFHRAFDRRVGEIVRQIDVPADLQSRLRESLASHATLPQPEMPRADDIRSSRRALLLSASAATLLMAVGVSWYVGHREAAPLTAATVLEWWGSQLTQTKNFDPSTLPAFDGGFDLAAAGDPRWLRLSQQEPRGADIDNDGRHDAAVVAIPGGFVVVLPAGRVTDPPSAGAAGSASAVYTPALHVAWTFKNSMHVCYFPGGSPDGLQQLLRKVYGGAA